MENREDALVAARRALRGGRQLGMRNKAGIWETPFVATRHFPQQGEARYTRPRPSAMRTGAGECMRIEGDFSTDGWNFFIFS